MALKAGRVGVARDEVNELGEINFPEIPGNATTSKAGIVKQSANQAATTAEDVAGLVTDFNSLLSKLKTAGIMAPDPIMKKGR